MSEQTTNERPPDAEETGDSTPEQESGDAAANASTVGGKTASRNLIAWLAILVALTALAASAYQYLIRPGNDESADRAAEQMAALSAAQQSIRQAVDALDARTDELANRAAGRGKQIEAIEGQFAERLRRLDSLPDRIGNLEGSMASLRGISSGLRDSWLLAEAEYYMQIANAQLQLAGNPKLALLALQLADEKIVQLANPALTDVRRALAAEIRALDSIDSPDIEGIALALSNLATVVDSLPLDDDIDTSDRGDTNVDAELSGMDRMFASLKKTVADIISVRRSDERVRPLIAPDAQYFLRANLALQFQAARIALLRGQQTLFDQSLDDAATWLNSYYDTNSAPVRSALQTVSEARQSLTAAKLPDISDSLRLLREYRVLSTSNRQAPAKDQPATGEADQ